MRDRDVESTGVDGSAVITVRRTIDGALTIFSPAPADGSRVIPLAGASLTWLFADIVDRLVHGAPPAAAAWAASLAAAEDHPPWIAYAPTVTGG